MADWRDDRAEREAARVLQWLYEEALSLGEDGSIQILSWGEPETGSELIAGRVTLHPDVSDRKRSLLVRQAVSDSLRAGLTTTDGLLKCLGSLEAEFLKRKPRPFVVLTSLSARGLADWNTVRIGPATVTFSSNPPSRFREPEKVRRHPWQKERFNRRTTVRVHLRQREPADAVNEAFRYLDLLRAFWNFGLNTAETRISFGPHEPVNPLILGPLHTVHAPSGEPATEGMWYEPEFEPRAPIRSINLEQRRRMKDSERWYRKRLKKIRGRAALESLFIRYCRALDQKNLVNAFLQTWAVLEDLTGNPRRYDDLIKRAGFLFRDRWYLKMQLEDMKSVRNRIVHEGQQTDRAESLVYTLKRIVEHYLMFSLKYPEVIRDLDDLTSFLAQPTAPPALQARIKRLELAHQIFTEQP